MLMSFEFGFANPIREYKEIDNFELKLAIGKKIYNQPGDGCWSCHGAEGAKSGAVDQNIKEKHKNISDLRNPATWTSFKIIKKYSGDSEMLSQRDISLSPEYLFIMLKEVQVAGFLRSEIFLCFSLMF